MINNQCKRCRRLHQKLFLKGERCFSVKCALVRKPYAPGFQAKRRGRSLSEYGRQLTEKQKLKAIYGISEEQLRHYFKKAILDKTQAGPADALLVILENRLDSIIFNGGWTTSRRAARQMVTHGRILVNKRSVNVPSQQVKPGDVLTIKKPTRDFIKEVGQRLKSRQSPSWLSLDKDTLSVKVLKKPLIEEIDISVQMPLIIEYFSH